MINNIIFDLDGTLIDSMPVWKSIIPDFLKNNNIDSFENLDEKFKAMSFSESNAYFKEKFGLKKSADAMIEEIISMVKEKYENEIPMKPFAKDFLLKEKEKGTQMFILTASEEDYVIPALKRLEIDKFFNSVFTCTNLGMSKSKKDIYSFAAKKAGVSIENTAVFEDASHAVENAKKAGFYVVAIEDLSAEKDKEKIMKIADRYVRSYKELL